MKKQKVKPSKRNAPNRPQTTKLPAPRKRRLHVHIALHPMSILVLLCAGVLLAASTWSAFAAIVTVKAVVPAPPLTEPAVITSPAGDEQTTTQLLSVQGTCPDNSYVTLSDNGLLAGVVTCSSGAFTISLDLSPGSNELQAQDYNITNDAGPV